MGRVPQAGRGRDLSELSARTDQVAEGPVRHRGRGLPRVVVGREEGNASNTGERPASTGGRRGRGYLGQRHEETLARLCASDTVPARLVESGWQGGGLSLHLHCWSRRRASHAHVFVNCRSFRYST